MDKFTNKLLSWCTLPVLGLVITACYLLGATWLLFDRVEQLKTMPLNEIGDFLAGIFGALAFFWLVIGYFMQNIELKSQIEEFKKNIEVSKNSLNLQSEIFNDKLKDDFTKIKPIFVEARHNPNLSTKNIQLSIKNIGHDIYEVHTQKEGIFDRDNRISVWKNNETKTIETDINQIEIYKELNTANEDVKQMIVTKPQSISFLASNGEIFRTTFTIRMAFTSESTTEIFDIIFSGEYSKGRL